MESNNPVLNQKTIKQIMFGETADTMAMTVTGTINKTGLLFVILAAAASLSWSMSETPTGQALGMGGVIGGLILALILAFNKEKAALLAPAYAVAEGLALGFISAMYDYRMPGVVFNAMVLTIGCLGLMLGLYRLRILQPTDRFRSTIVGATMAVGLCYVVDLVMMMFGHPMAFIHEGSPVGIVFSLVVVGVASLNLIMDFGMIESASKMKAPKYMEWYCGFALMITIVWVYLEMLRLLSKLSKR